MLRDSLPIFGMPPLFMGMIVLLWGLLFLLPIGITHRFMVRRAQVAGRPRGAIAWIFRGALFFSFVLFWLMCADVFEKAACTEDGKHVWQDGACIESPAAPPPGDS